MSPKPSDASSQRELAMESNKSAKENASETGEGVPSHELSTSKSRANDSPTNLTLEDVSTNTQGNTIHSHSEAPPAQLKDDGGGLSTDEEEEEIRDHSHHSDDLQLDELSKFKREKRLAMNRASARERRRRKRIHTEELEQRVLQLSRQCMALQKRNDSLQLYVVKLERDLANANAAINVLSKGEGTIPRLPLPPPVDHSSLFPPTLPPRAGTLASAVQEQERIRSLLGLVQQDSLAASRNATGLAPNLLGGNTLDISLPPQEDGLQRQLLLELLQRQQRPSLEGLDGLSSLLAARGAAAAAPPPLDSSVASLLGAVTQPPSAARAGAADNPALSLLASLQGRNPPPRAASDYAAAPPTARTNEAALLAAIAAERGGGSRKAAPPKKRRKGDC